MLILFNFIFSSRIGLFIFTIRLIVAGFSQKVDIEGENVEYTVDNANENVQ